MREILFRGKEKHNKNWVYGSFIPLLSKYTKQDVGGIKDDTIYRKVHLCELETVGQYTGLTDKNGTKIFEGDIIRYADRYEYAMYLESLECPEEYEGVSFEKMWRIEEVVYGSEVDYPAFDLKGHDFECNGLSGLLGGEYYFEVIGNIHDNPELLKNEAEEKEAKP